MLANGERVKNLLVPKAPTSLAASKPIETDGKVKEKHRFSSAASPEPIIRESAPPFPACDGSWMDERMDGPR